jgi:uncharacterized membrane protein YvbJ
MAKKKKMFYCDSCGTAVDSTARKCPSCGRYFTAIACPKCSYEGLYNEFEDGCPSCGYLADASEMKAVEQIEETKYIDRGLPLWLLIFMTLVVGVLIIVIVVTSF